MLLFTYGTLDHNHPTMVNAEMVCPVETVEKYYKGQQSFYPYLLEKCYDIAKVQQMKNIEGTLWEIPKSDFIAIDKYEGSPELFYRTEIEVEMENLKYSAQCYFINESEVW